MESLVATTTGEPSAAPDVEAVRRRVFNLLAETSHNHEQLQRWAAKHAGRGIAAEDLVQEAILVVAQRGDLPAPDDPSFEQAVMSRAFCAVRANAQKARRQTARERPAGDETALTGAFEPVARRSMAPSAARRRSRATPAPYPGYSLLRRAYIMLEHVLGRARRIDADGQERVLLKAAAARTRLASRLLHAPEQARYLAGEAMMELDCLACKAGVSPEIARLRAALMKDWALHREPTDDEDMAKAAQLLQEHRYEPYIAWRTGRAEGVLGNSRKRADEWMKNALENGDEDAACLHDCLAALDRLHPEDRWRLVIFPRTNRNSRGPRKGEGAT